VPDANARHVVLVGAMGSGKSTVGFPLASALARPFVDNDAQLLERTGSTAAAIEAQNGIDALHDAEARALLAALESPIPAVIAAAASTIDVAEVREALEHSAFVVWLRAAPAVLAARMPQSTIRPFASEDPARLVARQAAERDALYADVADMAAASDRSTPAAVVEEIMANLPGDVAGNR
jgi:shikimate kinase